MTFSLKEEEKLFSLTKAEMQHALYASVQGEMGNIVYFQ